MEIYLPITPVFRQVCCPRIAPALCDDERITFSGSYRNWGEYRHCRWQGRAREDVYASSLSHSGGGVKAPVSARILSRHFYRAEFLGDSSRILHDDPPFPHPGTMTPGYRQGTAAGATLRRNETTSTSSIVNRS
jgi:hypothetical protein